MSNEKSDMMKYVSLQSRHSIKLADNSILFANGKGDVKVYVYHGPKKINLILKDVLFVLDIRKLIFIIIHGNRERSGS